MMLIGMLVMMVTILQIDPDLVTGYNIANFDFYYLTNRARTIKAQMYFYLSRIIKERSHIKEREFSSKAYGRRVIKTLCSFNSHNLHCDHHDMMMMMCMVIIVLILNFLLLLLSYSPLNNIINSDDWACAVGYAFGDAKRLQTS
jgi:hypothetical protein